MTASSIWMTRRWVDLGSRLICSTCCWSFGVGPGLALGFCSGPRSSSVVTPKIWAKAGSVEAGIHTATHPGKLPQAARERLAAGPGPTAAELLAQLDQEAEEEEKG